LINFFGLTLTQIQHHLKSLDFPQFAPEQIARWIYQKNIFDFSKMTNLSLLQRQKLDDSFFINAPKPLSFVQSEDGTKKYLFPTGNGKFIETAFIPEKNRSTLCLSSQVGCKMGCLFCMTAKQGFQGQLSAAQIIGQFQGIEEKERITNLVYMGMGEPLDNIDEVLSSLEVFTSPWGYALSPKKITLSTIGILPGIQKFLSQSSCRLALSLHSPFEEERKTLMPIQTVYPFSEILDFLRSYQKEKTLDRLSIEYIVFKDLNHSPAHAKAMARILQGLKVRVNLIPYHPVPGTDLEGAREDQMLSFQVKLKEKGLMTTVRKSRGLDIDAACGLLSTKALLKPEKDLDY